MPKKSKSPLKSPTQEIFFRSRTQYFRRPVAVVSAALKADGTPRHDKCAHPACYPEFDLRSSIRVASLTA